MDTASAGAAFAPTRVCGVDSLAVLLSHGVRGRSWSEGQGRCPPGLSASAHQGTRCPAHSGMSPSVWVLLRAGPLFILPPVFSVFPFFLSFPDPTHPSGLACFWWPSRTLGWVEGSLLLPQPPTSPSGMTLTTLACHCLCIPLSPSGGSPSSPALPSTPQPPSLDLSGLVALWTVPTTGWAPLEQVAA